MAYDNSLCRWPRVLQFYNTEKLEIQISTRLPLCIFSLRFNDPHNRRRHTNDYQAQRNSCKQEEEASNGVSGVLSPGPQHHIGTGFCVLTLK